MAYKGFRVVDADRHFVEPTRMFTEYVEPRYRDVATLTYTNEQGYEVLRLDKKTAEAELARLGRDTRLKVHSNTLFGPGDALTPGGSLDPKGKPTWDDGLPGGYAGKPNLVDMDTDHIDLAYEFPTMGNFAPKVPDPGLSLALCRAINNFAADYCSADPARLFAIATIPLHDVGAAISELNRVAKIPAFKAVTIRPNPAPPRGKVLHDPENERFWAAVQDLGMPLCTHEGLDAVRGVTVGVDRFRTLLENHAISHPFEQMLAVMSFTTGGILERFPRLKVAVMESGCGWLPYWLERLDEHLEKHRWEKPELSLEPSEFFERQVFISCEPEEVALPLVAEHIGAHKVMFASDYPHYDATFPGMVAALAERADLTDDAKRKILGETAEVFYRRG
jgi:predicted TIM-barrel fold metal-dependent hydrolase